MIDVRMFPSSTQNKGGSILDKEQVAHDLALVVVENLLEDVDEGLGIRQYSLEAVDIYRKAREVIMKELD